MAVRNRCGISNRNMLQNAGIRTSFILRNLWDQFCGIRTEKNIGVGYGGIRDIQKKTGAE